MTRTDAQHELPQDPRPAAGQALDFVRYFTRVHQGAIWQGMQRGLAEFAGAAPGQRVLDVGSGPGWLVAELHGQGVMAVGADGNPRMAAQFDQLYPGLPYVVAEGGRLPFGRATFDAVLAGNLLFFLPDPAATLAEMVRVTRPGGRVAIWNPSERMSRTAVARYVAAHTEIDPFEQKHLPNWAEIAHTNRRWSGRDLAALFDQAGLVEFATTTTLDGLARYARGVRPRRPAR